MGKRCRMHVAVPEAVWAKCLAILVTTFLHEDGGIILGGYLVLKHDMPFLAAWLALYSGFVVGDSLIYGFGASARSIPWLRRLLLRNPVEKARQWLAKNQTITLVVCRMAPGLLFATFAACGFFRLPFRRFLLTTALTAFVYTPLMLWLAVSLGQTVIQTVGIVGWIILLILIFFLAAKLAYRTGTGIFRRMGLDDDAAPEAAGTSLTLPVMEPEARTLDAVDPGPLSRRVAPAERIPPPLFYIPVSLRWIWLGLRRGTITLPSAANPAIEGGGLWGESKSQCLDLVSGGQRQWLAPYAVVQRSYQPGSEAVDLGLALAAMRKGELEFPIVGKPDVGWQGYGVQVLDSAVALSRYLAAYPAGARVILQRPVPWEGEAGVFYVRIPGEERGRIFSLTFRYHPAVVGDGKRSVKELMRSDPRLRFKSQAMLTEGRWHRSAGLREADRIPAPGERVTLAYIGSIRVGGLYRDACGLITPAMTERFDAIARSMQEFHYGRFDIRFRSVDALQRGEDFRVFEINGAGAEIIHIWDPEKSVGEVFRVLFEGQDLLFQVGAANRDRGFNPISLRHFVGLMQRQNWLIDRYPPSE